VVVRGAGPRGLRAPAGEVDLGNSGTAMRLVPGVLAAQGFDTRLTGDASLKGRPMRRVTEPLARMGARVEASADGTPPLVVHGIGGPLRAIRHESAVASAQVKSCILLAGLYADGRTCVVEPHPSRDHTERMLRVFGARVSSEGVATCVEGGARLRGVSMRVPRDISSAAFFMVAAAIAADADLTLEGVGVNPTRVGSVEILRRMGARLEVESRGESGGEPIADIRVRSSRLRGIDVPVDLVASAIDEFPVLFVAAACAEGTTRVTGAGELRVKESDRIGVMADGLTALGVDARAHDDGMTIVGGPIGAGEVASHGDHRIAMAFAIAGLRAAGQVRISDCANVATSFPGFATLAAEAGMAIRIEGSSR
jgi:3-phosphoshikimate 1-carboxyvinyltransferase